MEAPESLGLETVEKIILRWDSTASEKKLFQGDRQEVDRYLQAVDESQRFIYSDDLNKIAMARLQLEFRSILISHSNPIEPHSFTDTPSIPEEEPQEQEVAFALAACFFFRKRRSTNSGAASIATDHSTSSIREIDIPTYVIYDLRCISERMISSAYLRECIEVYATVRKSALDATLWRIGIENLSIGDIQSLEWDQIDAKIRPWIKAAEVCVRTLFASEKKLCHQIFDGVGTDIDDACFMETAKGAAIQLFNFAEGISLIQRSPEKLFKILDLHEALINLKPDIDVVFDSKSSESIRIRVAQILSLLSEAARGILFEFGNAVLREPSKVPEAGETIHPLTRYVMNYITFVSDYKQTLNGLIVSKPLMASRYLGDPSTPEMDFSELEGKSPLAIHLIWIIMILQFNLEGKSKHYKDESLSHFFMMNNVHYMVQKVSVSPELWEMIGYDYLEKLTENFQVEATRYKEATLAKLLYCFTEGALKKRYKAFHAMFTEVHRTQAMWIITDLALRMELQKSISEKLIPAYKSFLKLFESHIESKGHIRYSGSLLEEAVSDFFEGIPVSKHLRRRRKLQRIYPLLILFLSKKLRKS